MPTGSRGALPWALPGAPFSPGWYKQLGLKGPHSIPVNRPGTKRRAFSHGLVVSVGKPGLEGVSQLGLKPTPALVVKIQYPIGPSYRLHIYVTQIFDQVAYENEPAPDDRACHLQ